MKRLDPATFADPDPVQRPVQRIQGIKQGFRLGFPTISPKSFSHFIQGLDGSLYFSRARCAGVCRAFLCHFQSFCSARTKEGDGIILLKGTKKQIPPFLFPENP
jgi:hypothetical protein